MRNTLTNRAQEALRMARVEAYALGHAHVGAEHLLLALSWEQAGVSARILDQVGCGRAALQDMLGRTCPAGTESVHPSDLHIDAVVQRTVTRAESEARTLGHGYVGTVHLLLGLTDELNGSLGDNLSDMGLETDRVRSLVVTLLGPQSASEGPEGEGATPPKTDFDRFPILEPKVSKLMESARQSIAERYGETDSTCCPGAGVDLDNFQQSLYVSLTDWDMEVIRAEVVIRSARTEAIETVLSEGLDLYESLVRATGQD